MSSYINPEYQHELAFKSIGERDTFYQYMKNAEIAFHQMISSFELSKLCQLGKFQALFVNHLKPVTTLCTIQRRIDTFVFQCQIQSKTGFDEGLEFELDKDIFVNTLHTIPSELGDPKNAHLTFVIRHLVIERKSIILRANDEIECMTWVLSVFILSHSVNFTSGQQIDLPNHLRISVESIDDSSSYRSSSSFETDTLARHSSRDSPSGVSTPQESETDKSFRFHRRSIENELERLRSEIREIPKPQPFAIPQRPTATISRLQPKELAKQFAVALSKLPVSEPIQFKHAFEKFDNQSTVSIVSKTNKILVQKNLDLANLHLPDHLAILLKGNPPPYNAYTAILRRNVLAILATKENKISDDSKIGPMLSVLFLNGLRTNLDDIVADVTIDGLSDVMGLLSDPTEFGSYLLNLKLINPVLAAISRNEQIVSTHYYPSSLMASNDTFSFVSQTMLTLTAEVEFDLKIHKVNFTGSRFRHPHFLYVGFSPAINFPMNVVAMFTFGMKSLKPIDMLFAAAKISPAIATTLPAERSKLQIRQLEEWITKQTTNGQLPVLVATLFSLKDVTAVFCYKEATLCDLYRCKMFIAGLNHYIKTTVQ